MAGGRVAALPGYRWARCLLTRADLKGWRTHLEFVSCLYNILFRRPQMRAVHLVMVKESRLSAADARVMAEVAARDFVSEAPASGDCESLSKLLPRKGLDDKLRSTIRSMESALRNMRGSEAEKLSLRSKFMPMHVWNGCSSLFFTLTPHDIRSPVTLLLTDAKQLGVEDKFSLISKAQRRRNIWRICSGRIRGAYTMS